MLLLLMGFYAPLISYLTDTVKQCFQEHNWTNFGNLMGILGCFLVGVIIGFFVISKIMHYLLSKYHDYTFYSIIGFVLGSVPALFFNFKIYEYYQKWAQGMVTPLYIEIPIGIVLLIGFTILSYMLVRYKRKIETNEKEIAE